jgi:ABC-type phosphate transport system substrate-binding protein
MVTKVLSGLLLAALVLCLGGCGGQSGGEFALHVYTRSDACGAAETWAAYLGNYHQEDLNGTAVYGDPGLAEAVKRDPLGIGYNNLNYAYDMDTGQPIAGLRVVPIDLNKDGQIDASEDFYATKWELMQAIATGQYPSPPARDLYFVTKNMFTGIAKEFVRWVLNDGQQYAVEVGYVALSAEKVAEQLNKLGDTESEGELKGKITVSGAWALYPMTIRWAEEFRRLHPDVEIDISAGGAGKGMVDALNGMVDIGMVSREIYPSEIESGAFWVAVTKDCVAPVVNEDNPVLEDLMTKGVKSQTLADIWVTGTITDWRDVVS